jgi:hypothetical protein
MSARASCGDGAETPKEGAVWECSAEIGGSPAGIMRAKRGGSVGRACGAGACPCAPVSAAEAGRGGGGGAHEREKRDTNISGIMRGKGRANRDFWARG